MALLDYRAALLIQCPHCMADPGLPCWEEDGSTEVDIHEQRIAEADGTEQVYTFEGYNEKGRWGF